MSLTKAALLDRCKPRVGCVSNVEEWGEVWFRTCPQVLHSHRMSTYFDPKTNEPLAAYRRADIHMLIDQMLEVVPQEEEGAISTTDTDGKTVWLVPMFTDEDEDELAQADATELQPLYAALATFNKKKATLVSESSDTSKN